MRVALFLLFSALVFAADPQFDKSGELLRPGADYREWIYVTTGLGMTYSAEHASPSDDAPIFDNIFVVPLGISGIQSDRALAGPYDLRGSRASPSTRDRSTKVDATRAIARPCSKSR